MSVEEGLEGVEEKFLHRRDAATSMFKTGSVGAAPRVLQASGEPGRWGTGRR